MNGNPVSIMKVNGMMAIQLESGENDICFQYEIPGFHLGIVISIISAIVLMIYSCCGRQSIVAKYDRKQVESNEG